MNIQPIYPYLLLKRAEKRTTSGVLLLEDDRRATDIGEIVALPEQLEPRPESSEGLFVLGQKVIFKELAPQEFKMGEDSFLLAHQDDILGIIYEE